MRARRSGLVAAAGVVLLTATACGSEQEPGGGEQDAEQARERMYDVAADPKATVDEIVGAGGPARVAVSGAGGLLVSYVVESDDDEGPSASAWRFYDADGEQLAEGHGVRVRESNARPEVEGLADGVLVRPSYDQTILEVVDDSGAVEPVRESPSEVATEPGDLLLGTIDDRFIVYRPSERTAYRLTREPRGSYLQSAVIDGDGGVWAIETWNRHTAKLIYSADGRAPWTESRIDLPRRSYPSDIVASGGVVAIPLVADDMDAAGLEGLYVRDATAPGDEPWTAVEVDGIETDDWYGPEVTELDDGQLLIGDISPHWYVGTETGDWTEVALPDVDSERDEWFLTYGAGRLYAYGDLPGSAYVSDDLGGSWDEVAR